MDKTTLQKDCEPFNMTWIAEETGIEYQRLNGIIKRLYKPNHREARAIARVMGKKIADYFERDEPTYSHIY